MKTNPEIFVTRGNGKIILFNPMSGHKLHVNESLANAVQGENFEILSSDQLETLRECSIIITEPQSFPERPSEYKPTSLTILPTFDCNLRCVYCYAMGGKHSNESIDMIMWESAVELIIKNALETKSERTSLGFHGGGEPLLEKNLPAVIKISEYFRKRAKEEGLKCHVNTITNGQLSSEYFDLITKNFNYFNFSIDGDKAIHDAQRPNIDGSSSYENLAKTILATKEVGKEFSLRTTVTSKSVKSLSYIVNHFHEKFSAKNVHLEPLFECGRCAHNKTSSPTQAEFLSEYRKARQLGKELGIKVKYSGDRESVANAFCGAAGRNFFLNPEGYATCCLEVCRKSDPYSEHFFIGKYNGEGFDFDLSKVEILQSRKTENLKDCQGCVAKFSCAGSCLAKTLLTSGDLFSTKSNWNCSTNKSLMNERLIETFERNPEKENDVTC